MLVGLHLINDNAYFQDILAVLWKSIDVRKLQYPELTRQATVPLPEPMVTEIYCQTSNIRHTLVGNKIADHSDVVGASPVGAAPTTSSFSA